MTSSQKIIGATVFFIVSTSLTLAPTKTKNLDALRAADAAWLKTYEAKDVESRCVLRRLRFAVVAECTQGDRKE